MGVTDSIRSIALAALILGAPPIAAADLIIVIVDPAGAPLPEARIEVRKPSEPPRPIGKLQFRGDAEGRFRLPEPEPGRYVVDVSFPRRQRPYRFGRISQEFDIPREGPVRVVVPGVSLFQVSGLVVDTEGELAWGRYLVEAHPVGVDDPDARPLAAPVDRNGGFALHGLARGRYEMRVARLDVARSAFGPSAVVAELEVAGDVKGLRLSAAGLNGR